MNKKYEISSLIFASGNTDKLREYRTLLGLKELQNAYIEIYEPQRLNMEELVEEKIQQLKPKLPGMPFFVEHTGLFIEGWKGLPGGLTRQFLDTVGCEGICKMMEAYEGAERIARAKVIIGFYHPNIGSPRFTGETTGTIATELRGELNFGWDSIFIPEGSSKTYGEMDLAEKNETSMRKKAAESFAKFLFNHFDL